MSQRPYLSAYGQAVGSIDNEPGNDCRHPQDQVESYGECASGCCTKYLCKACGSRFLFEWPD